MNIIWGVGGCSTKRKPLLML